MHDITNLEGRGLPSVGIASEAFVEAAAAQSEQLGADATMVFVPHPIQNRTDAELAALADHALAEILTQIRLG